MQTKRYNISKPRKYTTSSGGEKTYWDRVGEMVEFTKDDGRVSRVIKIPAIGLEANVFEDEPKEKAVTAAVAPASSGEVDPSEILF